MRSIAENQFYAFADFRLDPGRRLLKRNGETIVLHPKAFDLLLALIENRDRVLSKNELLNTVWEGQFVEEGNLAVQVFTLRKIFGEKKDEHRFIVTVPGRGYRFVAQVRTEDEDQTPSFGGQIVENGFRSSLPDVIDGSKAKERKPAFRPVFLLLTVALVVLAGFAAVFVSVNLTRSEPRQLAIAKLTTSGKVVNATLSRDGKFVVFAQNENGGQALWLRQTETGSQTQIALPRPVDYVGLSISPDNNFIYYSGFEANHADVPLRRIPLLGGSTQEIAGLDVGVTISFSPDGSRFAFTQASSSLKESYLKIADVDGSNCQTLLRAEKDSRDVEDFKASPVAWSPGGDEIALAVDQTVPGVRRAGISLVNARDGTERPLLEPRFAWVHSMAWTDAENLAFIGHETDEQPDQIWTISTKTGELRRVTNDLEVYTWLAASLKGALLAVQRNAVSSLQIADFDERTITLQPREVLKETDITAVDFGFDDSILYTSRASGIHEIWRVRKDDTDRVQLTAGANVSNGFTVSPKDGEIVFSSARDGTNSLWLADPNGKILRRLTEGEDAYPQFAPDGGSVVFQRGPTDLPTLWSLQIANASSPVQLFDKHSLKPTVSPDGSRAAFYFMDFETDRTWRVGLISTATGEFLGKLSFPVFVPQRRMRWHPSGAFLAQVFNSGETASLLLLPVIEGGDPKIVSGLGKGTVDSFAWSRDGSSLVYVQTVETQNIVSLTSFTNR